MRSRKMMERLAVNEAIMGRLGKVYTKDSWVYKHVQTGIGKMAMAELDALHVMLLSLGTQEEER